MRGPDLPGGEPTADTRTVHPLTAAATRRFPATTASVGQARRFLLGQLPASTREEDADELVLMLSELSTNAVQHAATEFEVAVYVAADCSRVRVEVTDGALGFPTPQDQVADAPHGRGLHIVRTLADAWGVEMRRDQPGKTVWFSLPLAAPDAAGAGAGAGAPPVVGQSHLDGGAAGPVPAAAPEPAEAPGPAAAPEPARPCAGRGTGAGRGTVRRPRPGTSRPGLSRGSGWCSTGCVTPWSPPTTRAPSVTSTDRPRSSWAGRAAPWSAGPSSISCPIR